VAPTAPGPGTPDDAGLGSDVEVRSPGASADAVLRDADAAMYAAKNWGGATLVASGASADARTSIDRERDEGREPR
jgi:hypothetical protein